LPNHIDGVKRNIVNVSSTIEKRTGMKCRFAVVVYRDYDDGPLRFQVCDFTTAEGIEIFLSAVVADGGGDAPEDCFGGLHQVSTAVSWEAPARVCLWICDAPQHGARYNGGQADTFPDGDPEGRTGESVLGDLQGQSVSLAFGRITSDTDAMIAELHKDAAAVSSELLEFEVGQDMAKFLERSLTATASRTKCLTKEGTISKKPKEFTLVPVTWESGPELGCDLEAGQVTKVKAYRGGDVHPLLDLILDGPHAEMVDVEVMMTKSPMSKGELRLAYLCKLWPGCRRFCFRPPEQMVAKESIFKGLSNSRQVLFNQAHMQLVAAFLGSAFSRIALLKGFQTLPISYPLVKVLHLPGRPGGRQYYCVEEFIEGEYQKFNNNNGYVNREQEVVHPILQTFSHFTYCHTRGILVLVDLQGVVQKGCYRLTDPAIHTIDPATLPDACNLGHPGMAAFFATHHCNRFCRALSLEVPEEGKALQFNGGIDFKGGATETAEYVMDSDRENLMSQ